MRLAPETIASLLYLVGAGILVLDAFFVVHRSRRSGSCTRLDHEAPEGIFGLDVIEKIYLSQEAICRDPPRHFHQGIYR